MTVVHACCNASVQFILLAKVAQSTSRCLLRNPSAQHLVAKIVALRPRSALDNYKTMVWYGKCRFI